MYIATDVRAHACDSIAKGIVKALVVPLVAAAAAAVTAVGIFRAPMYTGPGQLEKWKETYLPRKLPRARLKSALRMGSAPPRGSASWSWLLFRPTD